MAAEQMGKTSEWMGSLQGIREAAMQMAASRDKKDEDEKYSPFQGVQKSTVLQDSRCFSDPQINASKCKTILTKLLYLLGQGDKLSRAEATEVFFGCTKLFQSKDITLRRMVYLIMKNLNPTDAEVIIVTATLTKDMKSKMDLFRANAIRVLSSIILATDPSMMVSIERHLREALVDKNSFVSSTALVSGNHLMRVNPEVVKRWVNEVQTALQSDNMSVQYHALALLYQIKKHDMLAVSKIVASLTRNPPRSPLALCLLIRFVKRVIDEDDHQRDRTLFDFLELQLRHKQEMVVYEAACAMCNLRETSLRELTPAITVLQLFLMKAHPPMVFAAVRTLNRVAMHAPLAVTQCNVDMNGLIENQNRSIATLAITTLLKTGSDTQVEKLMKTITNFMSEIADEFKIVVVDAIRAMCLKFPQKHRTLMQFLSSVLREEGGYQYKKAIVDTILILVQKIPDAKEAGLTHLCEFIEDCEFTNLNTQILHLIGRDGPSTPNPSKYIRFIYNRIVLENATVRAAAVSALCKFGIQVENLRNSVVVLLTRCINDNDDEVRDRATQSIALLANLENSQAIYGVEPKSLAAEPLPIPLAALEFSLKQYMQDRNNMASGFSIHNVTVSAEFLAMERKAAAQDNKASTASMATVAPPTAAEKQATMEAEADLLSKIPQFAHCGPRFCSSKPMELTEAETEYGVVCVKHIFAEHTILQFNCKNTLNDQLLTNVTLQLDLCEGLEVETEIPCTSLPYDTPGTAYVCLRRESALVTGTIPCTLKFTVQDVDPETGEAEDDEGYADEYQIEELELVSSDYMRRSRVPDFKPSWEQMATSGEPLGEVVETFQLSYNSIEEAQNAVIDFLGMQVCENTNRVDDKAKMHTVLLSGIFLGGMPVLSTVQLKIANDQNVAMRLTIRSKSDEVSQFVASSVA